MMGGYNHGGAKGRRTELVGPVSGSHLKSQLLVLEEHGKFGGTAT